MYIFLLKHIDQGLKNCIKESGYNHCCYVPNVSADIYTRKTASCRRIYIIHEDTLFLYFFSTVLS